MPLTTIIPVRSSRDLKRFIDFPHDLYASDENYVPALYRSEKFLLTRHPFHNHSSMQLFLAEYKGRTVGRIAAIRNNNHNNLNHKQDGFFGFFDCTDSLLAAQALIEAASGWLAEQGLKTMIGPVNPSTNETCGLLIDGFERPPVVMMPYNYAYYQRLLETLGFEKMTDLIAYEFREESLDDKPLRLISALTNRLEQKGITIRKGDLTNFSKEVNGFRQVYNKAWDKNLGFVPMTDAEFKQMAREARLILDKDFCLVAEHEGEIIGFALAIPDINQVQRKLKKGRLFPFGFLKMLSAKHKVNAIRILALGILEPYRKMGIEAVFYGTIIQNGRHKKITTAEASWILENNLLMNRAIQHIQGKPYKTYRIYEKPIV